MVTSYKMSENEMGYRGSKSKYHIPQPSGIIVKEQRVDGSYFGLNPKLRCTLTSFERNHQVKILSKRLNNRLFSTLTYKVKPWFFTGFTDAEGCFQIKIQSNDKLKIKWRVRPVFSITLHNKDLQLLENIKNFIGVGHISKTKNSAIFAVESLKEIPVIINHFDNYPLITQKISDYLLFKKCFEIINKGEHLNKVGFFEILSLKSSLLP